VSALDRFVAARALAYFADALKTFVIPVLVFVRTGSAVMSGVALAVEYVPKTLLTPFAGAFSQRFRLRPQFFAVDGIRAALCAVLLFANSVELLMALSALIAVFTSYAYVLNESLVAVAFEERTLAQARLQAADQIARVATTKSFEDVDPNEMIELVTRYDTLDQTRAIARDYASRARAALEPFADSAAKEALDTALDFVLERDR